MPDKAPQVSNPNSASWVPFVVLASLALGNLLDLPDLESERPPEGLPDAPNAIKLQGYREALSGDPLKALAGRAWGVDNGVLTTELVAPSKEAPPPAVATHELEELLDAIHAWRVLSVIVNGGFGAVDTERRRRTRYAVVSGLARAEYVPFDASHMGVTRLEMPRTPSASASSPQYVPLTFERFGINDVYGVGTWDTTLRSNVDQPSAVLLLWVNWFDLLDTRLDDSANVLADSLMRRDHVVADMRCLAAINSDAVIRVFENLTKEHFRKSPPTPCVTASLDAYLPRATLPTANILRCAAQRLGNPTLMSRWTSCHECSPVKSGDPSNQLFTCEVINETDSVNEPCKLRFIRTICDDTEMVKLIQHELVLRGRAVTSSPNNVNLLIGEWDTSFSRAIQ